MKSGKMLLVAMIAAIFAVTTEADAGWGWHSRSAGGYGSGGSWGSYGSGGGSWGSSGGSWGGYSSRGSWGSYGSSGGSWGSSGGSWGSSGGSWGSSGGSWGSRGGRLFARRHARHGSWGSYGSRGGSWGGYSYPSYAVVDVAPMASYATPVYGYSGVIESAPLVESCMPIYQAPVYESAPVVTDDCCSGVINEGYIEGSVIEGSVIEGGVIEGGVIDEDAEPIEAAMPEGEAQYGDTALIVVNVPDNARVFVNGYETNSTGNVRQFMSSGLEHGKAYVYEVRAVAKDGDHELGETKVVRLTAGNRSNLTFATLTETQPQETLLTIRVPAEASVELAGVATAMSGPTRVFATSKLAAGKTWNNYQVKVTLHGVTKEHTMTIRGGENHELAFDFSDSQLASR